jgi:hypothetical protein
MTLERSQALSRANIPQPYCVVVTATGYNIALRTEGDGKYSIGMFLKSSEAFTRMNVPQLHRLIFIATD